MCDAARTTRFAALTLLLLLPLGCGQAGYKLAPVSGNVTLNNQPLAHADVSFYPTASSDLPYATGQTDERGHYALKAFVKDHEVDGAVVGENRVEISMSTKNAGKKFDPSKVRSGADLVPSEYNSESTLRFTVNPEGSTSANFTLTGAADTKPQNQKRERK
jgi:hypothetical protein